MRDCKICYDYADEGDLCYRCKENPNSSIRIPAIMEESCFTGDRVYVQVDKNGSFYIQRD